MTSKLKRATAVALIALTALGGAVVSADAGGNKNSGKNFNGQHVSGKSDHEGQKNWRVFRDNPYSCEYYHDKWKLTGSGFWKGRYYSCIYGW